MRPGVVHSVLTGIIFLIHGNKPVFRMEAQESFNLAFILFLHHRAGGIQQKTARNNIT